jgi:hypothetical protein
VGARNQYYFLITNNFFRSTKNYFWSTPVT